MDREAFTIAYAAQFRFVWNLCLTLLRNPADAEDAVQETFLRLLRQKTPPQDAEGLRAWLIARVESVLRRRAAYSCTYPCIGRMLTKFSILLFPFPLPFLKRYDITIPHIFDRL